jgi:hypothetical protein
MTIETVTTVEHRCEALTIGDIPFGRGALYYVLSNHFYIGEVKYKNEILPGELPPIMDRCLRQSGRNRSPNGPIALSYATNPITYSQDCCLTMPVIE